MSRHALQHINQIGVGINPVQATHPGGQENRGEQAGQSVLSHVETPGAVRRATRFWLSFAVAAGRNKVGTKPG